MEGASGPSGRWPSGEEREAGWARVRCGGEESGARRVFRNDRSAGALTAHLGCAGAGAARGLRPRGAHTSGLAR